MIKLRSGNQNIINIVIIGSRACGIYWQITTGCGKRDNIIPDRKSIKTIFHYTVAKPFGIAVGIYRKFECMKIGIGHIRRGNIRRAAANIFP